MKDLLVGDLVEKAFGGSAALLALRALSHKPASAAELHDIRELLNAIEAGRSAR